jgi:signal transduction histidine kinase/CheY-like chemotaxis protein
VPRFVDYCAVTLADPDGGLRRVPIHPSGKREVPGWGALDARSAAILERSAATVLRTGVTEFVPIVQREPVPAPAGDAAPTEWPAERGLRSYLTVPLTTRARTLGAVTFVTIGSSRDLDPTDVRLAEQLAERASTAVENARLYDALRGADRRKDQFLAVLAHELRNPLAPLASVADVLNGVAMGEGERRKAGAVLTRQVGLLTRLIDDLLDVARISEGKFVLRPEKTTLGALVGRAIELVEPQAAQARHTFTVDVGEADAETVVDGSRVVQAIANLLANAVKFSNAGSKTRVQGGLADGVATIRVEDEGIGFAPDRAERLFDMFTQEPGSDMFGGLGIGLYLVRAVAVLHGGTVSATSGGPGLGSVFTLRLPAAAEAAAMPASPPEPGVVSTPRRVLVADDNQDSVEMLALLLTTHGHEVTVAFDGEQALAMAVARPHDVALLDLGMPVMDGYAVARQLAGTAARPPLVVAISGWGDADARRRTAAAGFDHHLVKPVQWADLERVLTRG